jgi:formiminotetrahydrofolate cyclodeaminase
VKSWDFRDEPAKALGTTLEAPGRRRTMSGDGAEDYLALPLGAFLDAVAARTPAPGAGVAAAVTVGLAAGLVAMAAGFSTDHLDDAAAVRAQAEEARAKVGPLAQQDVERYADVLSAFALPKEQPDRRERVRRALSAASDVPVEIARGAAAVTRLAGELAARGNPRLRGEALTAGVLAAAAVRAAAELVEENLSDKTDARIAEVRALAAEAGRAG